MHLETKYDGFIVNMLEDAQDAGFFYAVFEMAPSDLQLQPHQLEFYTNLSHFVASGDLDMMQNVWTDNSI